MEKRTTKTHGLAIPMEMRTAYEKKYLHEGAIESAVRQARTLLYFSQIAFCLWVICLVVCGNVAPYVPPTMDPQLVVGFSLVAVLLLGYSGISQITDRRNAQMKIIGNFVKMATDPLLTGYSLIGAASIQQMSKDADVRLTGAAGRVLDAEEDFVRVCGETPPSESDIWSAIVHLRQMRDTFGRMHTQAIAFGLSNNKPGHYYEKVR